MVKKISVFITILGLFFVGIPQFTKNVKAQSYDAENLASPDLSDKEYLGNGVYRLYNANGVIVDYDIYNGEYKINGTGISTTSFVLFSVLPNTEYTVSFIAGSGTLSGGSFNLFISSPVNVVIQQFQENTSKQNTFITTTQTQLRLEIAIGRTFDNYTFKLQLEQGSTATPYQVPVDILKQHIQLEKDKAYFDGYDEGYDYGNDVGYDYGFEAGLNEVFNENNLMPVAEKKLKGTLGPSLEFFGFRVPIGKKVKQITLLNLYGYILKDLDWVGSGLSQGLRIEYQDSSYQHINFKSVYNDFNEIMEFQLDKDIVIDYIDIVLALDNAELPNVEVDNMLNHMANNLGFYINNKILNNDAIDRFKEIIEQDLKNNLEAQYQQELETLLDHYLYEEFQKGYYKGLNETDATGFVGLLGAVFGGLGALLGIEILPGIYIGAIIAVPLVFGIIFFILGKRKGD